MKKLKLIFLFVAALIANNCFASKANSTEDSSKDAFEINKELEQIKLPMAFGNVGEVTEMSVSGNSFRMVIEINEKYETIYATLPHEKLKEAFLSNIAPTGNSLSSFVDKGIGMTIVLRYKSGTKDETSINLTADEIRNKMTISSETMISESVKLLQYNVKTINQTAPIQLDEYTTLDSCSLSETEFTYNYTIQESDEFDLNETDTFQQILTQINKQQLRTQGLAIYSFLNKLVVANRKLHYSYKGNKTGKIINIVFDEPILLEIIEQIREDNITKSE